MNKIGNNEEDEEDVHYISEDEDITDIEKIIRERCKVFQNEKDAVRLFLSEHFRKFRFNFFSKVKMTHKSVYQAIKKEIRNCLNPYRIFIKDKKIENEKELKALYEELKRYYKEKNFNNTFFINYFKDLKQAHRNMSKSKFINMLPKNEEEALNDIHRKVMIIKSLKKYLTGTIVNRLQQVNLEKNQEIGDKDEFIMMYHYLVIKREKFSELNEKDLINYISNQNGSLKLRRALNDFSGYNYIPIFCKGHCKQEADLFIQNFEKEFYQNHRNCKECEYLNNNFDNIKTQIRSLYVKTCIFSHNINEIMFHPLFFFSLEKIPFYISELKNQKINSNIESLIETSKIPKRFFCINNYKLRKMYNENENSMKEIIKLLKEYSIKSNLFGGSCFLPDYKTKKCPLDLLKPNQEDWNNHLIKCPCYHGILEKRRIIKINNNRICPNVLTEEKWIIDPEKIKCKEGETCDKFHTRNEVFYDERNFRKLYPCTECDKKDENGEYIYNFCKKFDMCPKKHPGDIKINEIYLPQDYKLDLQRELTGLKEKIKNIRKRMEKIKKIECKCCLNYIDGEKGRHFISFKTCNHKICLKCYKICKLCPLCEYKSDQEKIFIKLEKNEEPNEPNDNSNNDSNEEDDSNNRLSSFAEEDNEIIDIDSEEDLKINDSNYYDVNYSSEKDKEENKESSSSEEKESNEESDKKEKSDTFLSSSYSSSNSRGRRGRDRGNIRGRGFERGRRVIRSRGNRGRGRGYH